MHKKFDHKSIEKKWQEEWKRSGIYTVGDRDSSKEKEYVLVELPYPSGNLHIGHWFAFAVVDIYVRAQRMKGKQVIFPIGFDSFGLPAENAAIKHGKDPKEWTESNIEKMKDQLNSMGNAFSWDKTASSIDPQYYKWTQWMFTKFFEKGIAYRGTGTVNWCPGCNTVIANEQVHDGKCERSGDVIERKEMPQWMLKITDFADELLNDLDTLDEWPEHIKEAQRQWIGKSEGAKLFFNLSTGDAVEVFTTRPDTLFGATYLVLAPEHTLVSKNKDNISNWSEVETYVKEASAKDDIARTNATKEKTGVKLEGITATNPANGEEIPVFVADYVLKGYGTGAIMAVPAHDERDFEFATKFNLPIKYVVAKQINDRGEHIEARRKGVYGLIKNNNNEYLLHYYSDADYYWLPGGGIEEGETEIECLTREIEEETGYHNITVGKRLADYHLEFKSRKGLNSINHTVVYEVTINESIPTNELKLTQGEIDDGLELRAIPSDQVIAKLSNKETSRTKLILDAIQLSHKETVFEETGKLINSGEFNGMDSEEAKKAITEKVGGKMTSTYRLRDWSIGRQRYWGTPIPIVYDPQGNAHPVPEEHLPWTLPTDVDFTPTGEPPLAKSAELKKRTEDIFGEGWTPEVETMDTFVDSSWYFLRYIDNKNENEFSSLEAQKEWMPIDLYFGGAEHTTMHLLYSRFWQKALYSLGLVTHNEPYKKRINRGLVLGPDGNKMSKSKGNVIDPDEQVAVLGADTVKMFLAFMGPYAEPANYPWDNGGIAGIRRFLERVYGLKKHFIEVETKDTTKLLHKTIEKVRKDIEEYKFNTAISAMMVFVNHAEKAGLTKENYEIFLKLLAPFAPHLTEELWNEMGSGTSIHKETLPEANRDLLADAEVTLSVQINGKMRGTVSVAPDASEKDVLEVITNDPSLGSRIEGDIKRVIYVPGKIINIIL